MLVASTWMVRAAMAVFGMVRLPRRSSWPVTDSSLWRRSMSDHRRPRALQLVGARNELLSPWLDPPLILTGGTHGRPTNRSRLTSRQ